MKNYLILTLLLFAFACQAQKAAAPAKKAKKKKKKTTYIATAEAEAKESSALVGKWKITGFEIEKANGELSENPKVKAEFEKKALEVGRFEFAADHTFKGKMVEGEEEGKWKGDETGRIFYLEYPATSTTDTLQVSEITKTELKGNVKGQEGVKLQLELTRTK